MECNKRHNPLYNMPLFLLLLVCFMACGCNKNEAGEIPDEENSIEMKAVEYAVTFDLFPNPERGFYKHVGNPIGELSLTDLKNYRESNISLILRVYYFDEFRHAPLSQEILDKLDKECNTIREAGVKLIVRFAYSRHDQDPDAPLSTIEQHLDQLAPPRLGRHKNIIAVMQGGLIGAWGEWYYTSNNLNTAAAQKAVLDKILDVLPAGRFVQVRTPGYKRVYTGQTTPLTAERAFQTDATSRIGHHNDCFMASADDYGTYEDVIADKNFLEQEGLFVPMGGETCPPSGVDPADCQTAQAEMRKLRWSYLNEDYYRGGVNDQWIVQGCMDNIIREMGYRIVMRKGEVSTGHSPGSSLYLQLEIENLGYAPPYNARNVELVLRAEDGSEFVASLPDDPRSWHPEELQKLSWEIALPSDIPAGNYSLYLWLPDPEASLQKRPEYAIRLGNKACWEATTGYNDLDMQVKIDSSGNYPASKASIRFVKK